MPPELRLHTHFVFLNVWLLSLFGPGFSNSFAFEESSMTRINSLTEFPNCQELRGE
jgi:hypothetical protein